MALLRFTQGNDKLKFIGQKAPGEVSSSLQYSIRAYRPAELFESNSEHCLILAATHRSYLDPWLLMIALNYRHLRALVPVRTLATQDPRGVLRWFMPLIRIMYWLGGVIELPPEDRDDRSLPEKLRGLLVALKHGDVVMIFPEGEIHRQREPPVGKFAPGVVYVYRRLGAPIVPIAVWMSERRWPRRRYVVQPLEYSSGGRIMIRKLKSGKYRLYSRKKDPKTVARYFLSLDQLFKQLQLDPDLDEEKARALVEQVASKDYSPPSREKVLEFQAHQQFPICPNPEDPDACNVYKDLRFPPEVYESINEYYIEKSGAEG